jgi:hypothetical protein
MTCLGATPGHRAGGEFMRTRGTLLAIGGIAALRRACSLGVSVRLGYLALLLLVAGACERKGTELQEARACEMARETCRILWAGYVADLPNRRRNYQMGACKDFRPQGQQAYRNLETMFSCPRCGRGGFPNPSEVEKHLAGCKPARPDARAEILVNVRGEHCVLGGIGGAACSGWEVEDQWMLMAFARVGQQWKVVSRCED